MPQGVRVLAENAAGEDIFFIPEVHFVGEKQMLADDDGWWYQVRSVIWCRACRKCRVRKEQGGFTSKEWIKKQLATCTGCDRKQGVTRVSSKETSKVRKRVKHSIPRQEDLEQPREKEVQPGRESVCCLLVLNLVSSTLHVTSGSEDDEMEGVEWEACMYGVRMTPAHPWYVGRGDEKCGGEVVYSIQYQTTPQRPT
jgi:hypothetical protein